MNDAGHPISLLLFGTLGVVLLIGIIMLIRFRSKNSAHPMEGNRERNIDEIREEAPQTPDKLGS